MANIYEFRHDIKRKADLEDWFYKMYDKIEETESLPVAARTRKNVDTKKEQPTATSLLRLRSASIYSRRNGHEREPVCEAFYLFNYNNFFDDLSVPAVRTGN